MAGAGSAGCESKGTLTRELATYCLVCAIVLASGCASPPSPVLHRKSRDYSEEIIYISPFLALWKARQIRGNLEWTYTLSQAQWGGEPESAGFTGDTYGKTLVTAVSLLGQSQPKGLLFGRGRDPAPRTLPDIERFFVLTYDRLVFFRTEAEMNACLRETWKILSPGMKPVGEFYDEQRARSQQEPAPSDAGSGS